MQLLRKRDVPEEKYTNAFLGFGPEDTNFALELTYSMFIGPLTSFSSDKTDLIFQIMFGNIHVCRHQ
jgi:hypothetical protein